MGCWAGADLGDDRRRCRVLNSSGASWNLTNRAGLAVLDERLRGGATCQGHAQVGFLGWCEAVLDQTNRPGPPGVAGGSRERETGPRVLSASAADTFISEAGHYLSPGNAVRPFLKRRRT